MAPPKNISPYNAARLATAPYVDPTLLDVPVTGYNITLRNFLPYLQQSAKDQKISDNQVTLRNAVPITSLAWVRYSVDKGLDSDVNSLENKIKDLNAQNSYNKSLTDYANAQKGALGEGGSSGAQPMPKNAFPVLLMLGGLAYVFRKKLHFA